jgi:hypothetical protein
MLIYVCFDNSRDNPDTFHCCGQTILNIPFTTISMNKTEPDLGLFDYREDGVSYRESMAREGSTHGYSPFFSGFQSQKQGHGSIRYQDTRTSREYPVRKMTLKEHR